MALTHRLCPISWTNSRTSLRPLTIPLIPTSPSKPPLVNSSQSVTYYLPRCTLDRPAGASPNGRMYIVNHFLDLQLGTILIPDDPADAKTNSAGSIEAQSNICTSMYGHWPNGVLVDYFNVGKYILCIFLWRMMSREGRSHNKANLMQGDVFTAQNYMNGL